MTPLPQESIAGLLNDGHKPIFLLGAGASVGSGVPLAGQLVESIAKFAYCKETARVFDDPTLMRSDWYGWLEQRPWFSRSVPPADLYPTAVEALLQPSSVRKEFFQSILHRALEPSAGYQRLVSLMAKRSITTVLTTNFDDLIAQTVKSTRAVGHCDEIKTPSDFAMFDTASSVPQVIYLHGSVDHYSDKNLVNETQQLDAEMVTLLRPLLRDHPLVVVGYRGMEPSVMRHLLLEQAPACMNFRCGIYWCYRKGGDPLVESPLLRELQSQIQTNLLFVEIDSFDGLLTSVDKLVNAIPARPSLPTRPAQVGSLPFDMRPSVRGLDDLSDALVRSKLVSYAEALREDVPALDTPDRLAAAMEAHHLAVADAGSVKATNGAVLLFAKRPDHQINLGWIDVTVSGPTAWVADVLDATGSAVGEAETLRIEGNLWEQLEQATTLLSRANRPFRMKGAVSHTAFPYPPLALKELLTNLIAHRSYVDETPARISITLEEITFDNPGGLVDVVTREIEDESLQDVIGVGSRRPKGYRNPVVADFFYSAGDMDKAGSGLPDVLREAANNLNRVRFGPTDGNNRFIAMIACRPEALQVDAQTRTAKASAGDHRYAANLLRVVAWPKSIWRIGTIVDLREVNKLDRVGADPFGCARGWIWTFAPKGSSGGKCLFDLAVEDEVEEVPIEHLLADRDSPSVVPALLNRALAIRLGQLGMIVRSEPGRMRAYYASLDGSPREISYRSTFKQARRTVAKPIVSRSSGKVVYWEHKAVYLRFEQFGEAWALTLLPGYIFTVDGEMKPIASEKIGPLSTRRAARDYNPTVLHDLVFWSRMLSDSHDESAFRLQLTRQLGGPIAEVASSIPTFVFQDSLEMSASEGEEVDYPPDLGEEAEDLQEQIERVIAEETTEAAQDEDSDR
jgi:NAD-dependent SIR2 family protein deacetylase